MLWDSANGKLIHYLVDPITSGAVPSVQAVAWSPDGSQVASADVLGVIRLWDAQTWTLLQTLTGHDDVVGGIAYSPDGSRLASAGFDGTVRLWDVQTGTELLTLYGAPEGVGDVAFSPDGTRLATENMDGTTRVYVLPIPDLIALAQSRLTRTLTTDECQRYLHVDTCPLLPQFALPTPAPELTAESTPG